MKTFIHLASVCMSVCLAVGGVARAADDEKQAVHAAIGQFHEALNVLFTGDAGPMKAVWSHADDVTYMGPVGNVQVGWKQVEPYWDMQAAKRLGGRVEVKDVHVIASSGLAVASYYEKGENVIDGKPQPVSIRSTTTFRKEGGQWKVVGHHTDPLAYLKK
jgi:ketosteroid isomerase-like protein